MGFFDFILKSKEEREQEAREAEEKRNLELSYKESQLYKEKKYDECLEICMDLVSRDFIGLGFWYTYLHAAEILYGKKRYKDILEVGKHYKWFYDRDADNRMQWYMDRATEEIKNQQRPKPKPQPIIQPKPQPTAKPAPTAKPTPKPVPSPKPEPRTVEKSKPIKQDPPKPTVRVPKWDDDDLGEPEEMKAYLPFVRPQGSTEKVETLYWQYLQAKKLLPPYDMLGEPAEIPYGAVNALNRVYEEAQRQLNIAEIYLRRDNDWRGAAVLYENLIANKYWEAKPYIALIDMYEREGEKEAAQEVRRQGISTLRHVQRRMRSEFLEAARKIDAEDLALDMIEKGEKVVYGAGLYTVYDPFPCIGQWEQELESIAKS